ncbi:hypothetical protein E2P81_ATG10343 [Venturia nashicola]|nr:hypothetical protein E2P81_ATG10343 [Venturia nashicola]
MRTITNIILALGPTLATSTEATAPIWYNFDGVQKMARDSSCAPWFLYYRLSNATELEDRTGYFEVDGCLNETVTVGDNVFTLNLDPSSNFAIITDVSSGLSLPGGVGKFDKKADDSEFTFTCFYGVGPSTFSKIPVPDCDKHP